MVTWRHILLNYIVAMVFLFILIGCSSGGGSNNPAAPSTNPESETGQSALDLTDSNPDSALDRNADSYNHSLIGYFEVYINPDTGESEIVPVREAEAHWNILKFMEKGPCYECFKFLGIQRSDHDSWLIGFQVTNPFTPPEITAFDVRGIMMFPGSKTFSVADLKAPDLNAGDSFILNADGFTTLFNPSTIGNGPLGLQGYFKGNLATNQFPDCDLNPFKRFISNNPANTRNALYGGGSAFAIYDVIFSTGPFVFGYAIDANWEPAIVQPVTDPMTDFALTANCPEPWKIDVTEEPVGAGLTNAGGQTMLTIDVYDWQGKDSHKTPVVECPGIFIGALDATFASDYPGYSRWQALVDNQLLAEPGPYECLISVEDNLNGPPQDWLDLTAYQIITLEVGETNVVAKAGFDPESPAPCQDIIFFDDGSFDLSGGTIINWEWDWENDGTYDATGIEAVHQFETADIYYVRYKVTSDSGDTGETVVVVPIVNALPTAVAKADKTGALPGTSIMFDGSDSFDNDCGGNSIITWLWDWENDGIFDASGDIASHVFTNVGVYYVNLSVTDDEGDSAGLAEPLMITIDTSLPPVPVPDFNPKPATICVDLTFTGEASYDPDGGNIQSYKWDFDHDGLYEEQGMTVVHKWNYPGDYPIRLKVTDDEGQEGVMATPMMISVQNILPVAIASAPEAAGGKWWVNAPLTFSAAGSFDPDCGGQSITKYEWDWENDGVFTDTGISIQHIFDQVQVYDIQLRVTDDEGATNILEEPLSIDIQVQNLPPVAKGKADPNPQYVCMPIHFSDDGSYDQDIGPVVKWEWDWNIDGIFEEVGQDVYHTWDETGDYFVNLRVTDEENDTDTLDVPIPISIINSLPVAVAIADTYEVFENQPVHFDGSESYDTDCNGMEIVLYDWDFNGEGYYNTDAGPSPTHSYSVQGMYYPNLRVTDDEGGQAALTEHLTIKVNEYLEPVAVATANPNPQIVCEEVDFDATGSYPQTGGSIVKYEWNFNGDGMYWQDAGPTPSHSFEYFGTYFVGLRVTDNLGAVGYLSPPLEMSITNLNPTAIAIADKFEIIEGETVYFDGSESYDNDCGGNEITEYDWSFEGDGYYMVDAGPTPSHTYSVYGVYNVNLRVWDDEGGFDTLDQTIQITVNMNTTNPVAIADRDPAVQVVCEPVHFYDNGSYPQSGDYIETYEWDWNNDGYYDEEGSDVYHTWFETGTYYVGFRVTDNLGNVDALDEPLMVIILDNAPTAVAYASAYEAPPGEDISFDATSSHDNDCSGNEIVKFEWNFNGDGYYWWDFGPSPVHSYSTYGSYDVRLRVTDDEGSQAYLDPPLLIIIN
ncbi:MAG: PKD domain-containing protein [bacterium]|nr:PKD domain-containing protein [bacterium]